jgi:hypothetical protein
MEVVRFPKNVSLRAHEKQVFSVRKILDYKIPGDQDSGEYLIAWCSLGGVKQGNSWEPEAGVQDGPLKTDFDNARKLAMGPKKGRKRKIKATLIVGKTLLCQGPCGMDYLSVSGTSTHCIDCRAMA